jgi:DNA-binding beta-propeller fold protein YncE
MNPTHLLTRVVTRALTAGAAVGAVLAAPVATAQTAAAPHYHIVTRIAIGKLADGYSADFIAIDPVHRRLYGLGNTIVDIDHDRVVDSIPGKSAGGYALAPDLGSGLARNGTQFDLANAKVTGHVDGRGDASVYDPVTHRAFMLDDTVTVVDMRTGAVVTKAPIAPKLESGVSDGAGHLYINREDSSIVTKVDARTLAVEARYPIPDCKAAQGLSFDAAHKRLFLGCDKELVVVNADNGAVVSRIPVAGHADQNAFDPSTQLAFNANRPDSTLVIVHEDAPDHYSIIDTIKTGGGARSLAVDPKTHKVYAFYYDQPSTDRKTWTLTAVVLAP